MTSVCFKVRVATSVWNFLCTFIYKIHVPSHGPADAHGSSNYIFTRPCLSIKLLQLIDFLYKININKVY